MKNALCCHVDNLNFDIESIVRPYFHLDAKKFHHFKFDGTLPSDVTQKLKACHINPGMIQIFYTPPFSNLGIHVDGAEFNDNARLNWRFAADKSWMIWFDLKPSRKVNHLKTGIGTSYLYATLNDVVETFRSEIKQPSLVNVGHLHSVKNMTKEGRWVVSLSLHDDITGKLLSFSEAVAKLSNLQNLS